MGGTLRVRPAYLTLGITGLVLWLGPDFAAKVEYARTKARVEAAARWARGHAAQNGQRRWRLAYPTSLSFRGAHHFDC